MMRPAYFLFFALTLVVDFLSKMWVQESLPLMDFHSNVFPYGGIGVFNDFMGISLSFVHAINYGAAWSLFSDYPNLLVYFRIALISAMAIYYLYGKIPSQYSFGYLLVLSGAVGNVIDYFLYGHVVDMIKVNLWSYEYPVFNVADSLIFIGMVYMFIINLKLGEKNG